MKEKIGLNQLDYEAWTGISMCVSLVSRNNKNQT